MAKELRVALFVSRNKDNMDLEGFKQRKKSFLTSKTAEELLPEFEEFSGKGVPFELSRFYIHINPRDNEKIIKDLLHYLIDNGDYDVTKVTNKIASIASKTQNRTESKWLFDFDETNELLSAFLQDVKSYLPPGVQVAPYSTPNGHAVIVDRGFDTRELLERWENVELKRDGMLCYAWRKKFGERDSEDD